MAATKARRSSFSRNFSTLSSQTPGLKHGPNGTTFISSGIPDLDSNFLSLALFAKFCELGSVENIEFLCVIVLFDFLGILGGGFSLGSLVMVMEDSEAPHHMLLLRNFMSQGLVHNQSLLYASPSKDPRGFLGTLPSPASSSKDDKSYNSDPDQVALNFKFSFARCLIIWLLFTNMDEY